jgi:hypothetical protein
VHVLPLVLSAAAALALAPGLRAGLLAGGHTVENYRGVQIACPLGVVIISTSSSPAASSPRSARASPPPRSAALLEGARPAVTMQKLDPYINVDPGTMSPFQHGEVFVTDDGAETDLDLGHYERFIDENLRASANVTTGRSTQA